MADSYLTLAADYDWLFGSDVLTGGDAISSPATARLLQRTGRGSAVLDASCGTGINAEVLARRGFDVVLCVGNSLVHAAGRDAMVAALTGLRRMTRRAPSWPATCPGSPPPGCPPPTAGRTRTPPTAWPWRSRPGTRPAGSSRPAEP